IARAPHPPKPTSRPCPCPPDEHIQFVSQMQHLLEMLRSPAMEAATRATPLERALGDAPAGPTPVDALRLARDAWLHSRRLDMGALAAELGTSRATLYRWVGTRERLLGEVAW